MKDYTVVITSCGRFDLLTATLQSLLPRLTGSLAEVLVIEDSGDAQVREILQGISPEIRVIVNEENLGQLRSIDRAYSEVRTDYVFHCEDDWEFYAAPFIEPSFELLDAFPDFSLVSLRPRDELNPKVRDAPSRQLGEISYFVADPTAHPEYFGYSFNPGLRRMSDYRRVGPLSDLRGERMVSYCFKKLGYRMAYLDNPCVRHIGDGRHVDDQHDVLRPQAFGVKLAHSVRLRADRLQRFMFPALDPAVQILKQTGTIGTSRLARKAA